MSINTLRPTLPWVTYENKTKLRESSLNGVRAVDKELGPSIQRSHPCVWEGLVDNSQISKGRLMWICLSMKQSDQYRIT
ncbi:hypothetical protein GCM10007877_18980 [Marinibactrum halimedae]|uniref:Uncharacterized protein n=1 Tax=Marinibactrum halimedae TaxID=1444977 RepID=A0AA37T3L9_9GAMM|nr:hypothetical protein GCM10007877_18980 [Marinibactrum halimedae]